MFSSLNSVTIILVVSTVIQFSFGICTLAVSIAASVHTDAENYGIFTYFLPAKYTISLLSIASASLGVYLLRLKPRQRFIVDVFQMVNAVTGGVVLLSLALNLAEAVARMGHDSSQDEWDRRFSRYWVWWGFLLASAVMVGVAACLNFLGARAYRKLNLMESHSALEFLKEEVNILKSTSVAQIAAGVTLFAVSLFGIIDAHFGWFGPGKIELLWYSAVLEFAIASLAICSGAKAWGLIKNSTRTKRQFDVLSTINMVTCVIVALQLALASVTDWTVSIAHMYKVYVQQLWHYYTITGLAGLVIAVVILVLAVKTVKVSRRAAGWITPAEMDEAKIRFTSGVSNPL